MSIYFNYITTIDRASMGSMGISVFTTMDFHPWTFEIITTMDFYLWAFEIITTMDFHPWAFEIFTTID